MSKSNKLDSNESVSFSMIYGMKNKADQEKVMKMTTFLTVALFIQE